MSVSVPFQHGGCLGIVVYSQLSQAAEIQAPRLPTVDNHLTVSAGLMKGMADWGGSTSRSTGAGIVFLEMFPLLRAPSDLVSAFHT